MQSTSLQSKKRHTGTWKTYAYICCSTYGSLARSHYDLRFLCKVFFSADAFGKFGALDVEEDWACEARRYYFGIVGKYGAQVQALLKKAADLDIQTICPLHGPVLNENLDFYRNLYQTWSAYEPEDKGVLIAYTSVYGNTKKAAELLAQMLVDKRL